MTIVIKCKKGVGDKEADPISDSLLITENMAVTRGRRFLDDPSQGGYYNTIRRTFKVPHKTNGGDATGHIQPGCWVTVTDGVLGLQNTPLKVVSYTIDIGLDGAWATMGTEEYNEPE